MAVVALLSRAALRRQLRSVVALGLVVAAGFGAALVAFNAAARTDRAYPDYLRDADVGDVVVNPSLSTSRADEIIRGAPGVEGATTDDALTATADDGAPRTQAEVDNTPLLVLLSADGRYADSDRPVVTEGRFVRDGREAFVSEEAAEALGVGVGDDVPLAFWGNSYNTPGVGPGQEDVVEPVGRSRARVVGIGRFSDEVFADDLYPRQRMVVTPEVAGRYTCTFADISSDNDRSVAEILAATVPRGCALSYRFWSLDVAGGDRGVPRVVDALEAAFEEENARLPEVLREQDVGYIVIPTATRDVREEVERSLRPAVAALRVAGATAAVATIVVAGLAAFRIARRAEEDAGLWRSLGVTWPQRSLVLAAPLWVAALAGAGTAFVLGWLLSPVGPVSSARAVTPDPGFGLEPDVALAAGLLGVAALVLVFGGMAALVARARPSTAPDRPSVVGRAVRGFDPARATGVRSAVRGAAARAALAGATVAVAVVFACLVFSASVGALVDRPARYGWPYDAAVMVGFGYGGAVERAVAESLDRPEVEDWGLANLGSATIEGETVASVAVLDRFDTLPMEVVEGRLPAGASEVALGSRTAHDLGIEPGDEIDVDTFFGAGPATVTGTVVLPAVGPYGSDRAGPGTGVLLSRPFFDGVVATEEQASGLPPGSFAETGLGSFVAIDLRDDVDPAAFLDDIDDELLGWDRNGFKAPVYARPVRPPEIVDVADMRAVPVTVGVVVALAMAGALAIGIAVATADRRRELAILEALGCSTRQLASSVRWHGFAVVAVALLIGAPLGGIAGRLLYRAFASDLGVLPDVVVPLVWTGAVVVAAVGVGWLAGAAPRRRLRREPVAPLLHGP